jgi:hypothetical protein
VLEAVAVVAVGEDEKALHAREAPPVLDLRVVGGAAGEEKEAESDGSQQEAGE